MDPAGQSPLVVPVVRKVGRERASLIKPPVMQIKQQP